MSQITTHVLDTSRGLPAEGIEILLYQLQESKWEQVASGTTDPDGRIGDLLDEGVILAPGKYRLEFITEPYFLFHDLPVFYPEVSVVVMVSNQSHHHIPLLLSPFGYSTYRGS